MILRNTEFALFIFWLYWIIKHFICDKQNTVFLKIIQEKYIENEKKRLYL